MEKERRKKREGEKGKGEGVMKVSLTYMMFIEMFTSV